MPVAAVGGEWVHAEGSRGPCGSLVHVLTNNVILMLARAALRLAIIPLAAGSS